MAAPPSPHRARIDGDEPLALGVAAALARRYDVDVLPVRAAFVVLTVAGGWGAVLYAAAWPVLVWRRPMPERPHPSLAALPARRAGVLAGAAGALLVVRSVAPGFHDLLVWPAATVAALLVVGWRGLGLDTPVGAGGALTPEETQRHAARSAVGLLLVLGGIAYLAAADLPVGVLRDGLVAMGVVAAGVLLVFAPWVAQLTRTLADERRGRIRADERAEVAIHLHDSVLQTLMGAGQVE